MMEIKCRLRQLMSGCSQPQSASSSPTPHGTNLSPNTWSFALRTLSLVAVILLAAYSAAAPALAPRPPRWEYAELMYRSSSARPAGVGPDGTEVPAVAAAVAIHWISGAGEIEVKGWSDLAEKLKATGFKKEGSPTFQKIQILNFLGEEGWEL